MTEPTEIKSCKQEFLEICAVLHVAPHSPNAAVKRILEMKEALEGVQTWMCRVVKLDRSDYLLKVDAILKKIEG